MVAQLRGRTEIAAYRGMLRARPGAVIALSLAFLSLVGIPPLAGFLGKFVLFSAALEAGYGWLVLVAVANTVLSLVYYLRVIGPAVFAPAPDAAGTAVETLGGTARAMLWLACALLLATTLLWAPAWTLAPATLLP